MASSQPTSAGNYPVTANQVFIVVTISASAMVCGAQNGWTAVLPRLQEDNSRFTVAENDVAWLVSMTPLVTMAFAVVSGLLMECMGPCRLMLVSLVLSAGSWFLMAFTPYIWLLYIGRACNAAANCFMSTFLQPFVAEMCSTNIRGLASTLPEILGALGALMAFLMASYTRWYIATALCSLPSCLLILPSFFVPESPYWLVRRSRMEDARASLSRLAGPHIDMEKELSALSAAPTATQTSYKNQCMELRKSQNGRPVLLVLLLFVLRELGGRSAIFQYSVYIFQRAGVDLDPFTCTVLLGAARLLFVCVSASILDRVGRRPVLMAASLLCALSQGLAGLFLYLELPGTSWVPLLALLIYVSFYGLGVGPIPWVFVGEMLPSPVRSLGASIIVFCNTLVVFSINIAFFRIISSLGLGLTMISFGGCTFLVFVVVWWWIPETRGVSLQELEQVFSSCTKQQQQQQENVIIAKSGGTNNDNEDLDDWKHQ